MKQKKVTCMVSAGGREFVLQTESRKEELIFSVRANETYESLLADFGMHLENALSRQKAQLIENASSSAAVEGDVVSYEASVSVKKSICDYVLMQRLLWELKGLAYGFFDEMAAYAVMEE